jgi:hypothetical protein
MDIKKLLDAHQTMAKCLKGECDHKTLSKCMDKIAEAHDAMGEEINGEAKKSLNRIQGDLAVAKLNAISKDDPAMIRKSLSVIHSAEPTLVD